MLNKPGTSLVPSSPVVSVGQELAKCWAIAAISVSQYYKGGLRCKWRSETVVNLRNSLMPKSCSLL